jgi:hypothetical protein
VIGPFMKVYGSKWSAARSNRYPAPLHDTIYEPFAGGAGYSCRHHEKQVILNERSPELLLLWDWLICEANEATIREIPILPPGTNIRSVGLSVGQILLVKWWQRTNNHGTKSWIVSPWGNKPGQWTESTRSRIAEQVEAVKHWRFDFGFQAKQCTVFIDPPYEYNYQYGFDRIRYHLLTEDARESERNGCQVIACEALGPNGERPTWLPFVESHSQVTSRRKSTQSHHSRELLYVTGGSA